MPLTARPIALLVAGFIASRAVIDLVVPYWYETLNFYMQYLDPQVLRHDLAQGLFYLHAQPPLFNVFLGLFLKVVPAGLEAAGMALTYAALGLVIVLGTYGLMRCVKAPPGIALALSLCWLLFPSMIIAERWLFYSYPLAATMVLSALALNKAITTRRIVPFVLFLALVAAIVLMRGFFHVLFWMLPIVAAALWWTTRLDPGRLKVRAALAIVSILIGSSIYVKNYLMFGTFTSSTLQGMNVAGMTRFVDRETIDSLVAEGRVTPLARIPRFSEASVYFDYYKAKPQTGVEVLDRATKSTGSVNWNNAIYAKAAREYQANTLAIVAADPAAYLWAVLNEMYIFFGFTPYRFFDSPLASVRTDTPAHRIWDTVSRRLVPLVFALVFFGVAYRLARETWRRRAQADREGRAVSGLCAYLGFNLAYTFTVATLAELGEGCVMRIPVDPFLCVGLALALTPAVKRLGLPTSPPRVES